MSGGTPVGDDRLRSLLSVDVGGRSTPSEVGGGSSSPAPSTTPSSPGGAPGRRRGAAALPWLALAGLVIAGMLLGLTGVNIIRNSTEGQVFRPVSDPTAPGYEALVEPTPTMAVFQELGGRLSSITVLTLPDPSGGGGGVVFVPAEMVDEVPGMGVAPISLALFFGSHDALADVVGDVLGAGIPEFTTIDAERWEGLVEPVAPLVLDNPSPLDAGGGLTFPAGRIEIRADEVAGYLDATIEGESDLARLFRHELFWTSWLTAVAEAGTPDAVPGELESGVGAFVRTLAGGPTRIETLPVRSTVSEELGEVLAVQRARTDALVAELVPFPRSPRPGVRPRLRVLDGTGTPGLAAEVASELVPVGVTVALVGNAPSFDVTTTTVTYLEEAFRARALDVASALGVDEVELDDRYGDGADITVTLGADHV